MKLNLNPWPYMRAKLRNLFLWLAKKCGYREPHAVLLNIKDFRSITGISWEAAEIHGRGKPTWFKVIPPTIDNEFGEALSPTLTEFMKTHVRSPDKYEYKQTVGLNPFLFLDGVEETSFPHCGYTEVRRLAAHLYIAPEKRVHVLLRTPENDQRIHFLKVWDILDATGDITLADFEKKLYELDSQVESANYLVTDEKLKTIGDAGWIQDGMVFQIVQQYDIFSKKAVGVPVRKFFAFVPEVA